MVVSVERAPPVAWFPHYAEPEDIGAAMKRDRQFMDLLERGRKARLEGRTRPLDEVIEEFGLG